jgi:hypothetical protein
MRRTLLLATVVTACFIAAGCGDREPSPEPAPVDGPLTVQERRIEDRAVREIRAFCRGVARYLAAGGDPPRQDVAVDAARRIAALARRKPEARYEGSQTARGLAGDLAEDLEGTNCSRILVAELERGL